MDVVTNNVHLKQKYKSDNQIYIFVFGASLNTTYSAIPLIIYFFLKKLIAVFLSKIASIIKSYSFTTFSVMVSPNSFISCNT
jgi:hypothetical protein